MLDVDPLALWLGTVSNCSSSSPPPSPAPPFPPGKSAPRPPPAPPSPGSSPPQRRQPMHIGIVGMSQYVKGADSFNGKFVTVTGLPSIARTTVALRNGTAQVSAPAFLTVTRPPVQCGAASDEPAILYPVYGEQRGLIVRVTVKSVAPAISSQVCDGQRLVMTNQSVHACVKRQYAPIDCLSVYRPALYLDNTLNACMQ